VFQSITKQHIQAVEEVTAEYLETQVEQWRKPAQRAHARRYHEIARIVDTDIRKRTGVLRRVLEVGCGDGYLLEQLRMLKMVDTYGLDISIRRLFLARSRVHEIWAIQGDAERVPFANGAFDVIVCTEVLEHLVNPVAAINEMKRILAAGGLLILTVPSVHTAFLSINPLFWFEAIAGVYFPSVLPPFHNLYDPRDCNTVIHWAFSYADLHEALGDQWNCILTESVYAPWEGVLPLPDNIANLELLWKKIPVLNKLGKIIHVVARKRSNSEI
jgi:SAM-dependent methyltransferase